MNAKEAREYLQRIPDDEPVFVLRAQDALATHAILVWVWLAAALGVCEEKRVGAAAVIDQFETWQKIHPPKLPD